MTVDPKVLPKLFADCREIANSPKVAARSPRRAGDFSAGAARMIEAFGFVMELGHGTRQTAARVELRKKSR